MGLYRSGPQNKESIRESLSKQQTDEEGLMADHTSQYTARDYNYVGWMDILSQAPKSWL